MENLVKYKGYGKCLELKTDDKGQRVFAETSVEKLIACQALLSLSVEKNIQTHIKTCVTPLAVWNALKGLYVDKGLSRKIGILRQMISTRLEDTDGMQAYIDTIVDCSNRLNGIGLTMDDQWIAAILLAGLTENYKPLIMALEATTTELKSDLIIAKLLDAQGDTPENESGFFSKKGNKSQKRVNTNQKCKNCGRNNHPTNECRDEKKCFNCKKPGHLMKDCRSLKKNEKSKANTAFVTLSLKAAQPGPMAAREWFIDSGGSRHMSYDGEKILNKQQPNTADIVCANNQTMKVKAVGETKLKLKNEDVSLKEVLHVPELGVNLLSVSKMVEKGNTVYFDKQGCTIRNHDNDIVAQVTPENGVYKLTEKMDRCMAVCDAYTWHRRLGHINFNALKSMRDGAVVGIDFKDDGSKLKNCEVCCKGKMSRLPFGSNGTRATKILELIHSDLAGPMENPSIGKAKYLLTFIDDFSHKTFVYFLKTKGEVFSKFKEFKNLVENQTGRKIQKILDSIDEDDENTDVKCGNKLAKQTAGNGALSSTEAEYMAMTSAACGVLWMQQLVRQWTVRTFKDILAVVLKLLKS